MSLISLSQQRIKVNVDFFDESERSKLQRYPTFEAMDRVVRDGLSVPTAEFLTYYLFHRKRLGAVGYRDYNMIGQKIEVAIASLDGCIDFNGVSCRRPHEEATQLTEISEHVGEAIGLSVIAHLHGLVEADWSPITEQHGFGASPTFDFHVASDGDTFIQLEAKGSSVTDNQIHSQTITKQKSKITEKKNKLTERGKQGKDPYPAALRYGTVTAVDHRPDSIMKCWLVDPPPEAIEETPRRLRLLQRIRFFRDVICFVSPRSQLASALSTRLVSLEHLRDPFELDQVPLLRGNGEPFEFVPYDAFGVHSSFLRNKARIADGPAGGILLKLSDHALFLVGLREQILPLAYKQEFSEIMSYTFPSDTVRKTVECVLSRNRFEYLRLPRSLVDQGGEGEQISFRLDGEINYSPGGLVFGILPLS